MTGPTKIGKSTLLEKIYLALKEDYSIGGIITLGQETRKFLNLNNGEERYFKEEKDLNGISIGDFFISDKSIEFASDAIRTAKDSKIIFIDEIGILENEKKLLYEPVKTLLEKINLQDKFVLLCLRERVLPQLIALLKLKIDDLWRIRSRPDDEILNQLIRFIKTS